jgi:hypothetical protein
MLVVRVSESGELHQPSTIVDQGPSASRGILAGGCCTGPSLVCSLLCWWAVGRCMLAAMGRRSWDLGLGTGSAALDRGIFYLRRVLSVARSSKASRSTASLFLQFGTLASVRQQHAALILATVPYVPVLAAFPPDRRCLQQRRGMCFEGDRIELGAEV